MAGYDPKAKRTHSPAATDRPAPVDDLLAAPAAPTARTTARPSPTAATASTLGSGPVAAGVAVLAIVLWRRRR